MEGGADLSIPSKVDANTARRDVCGLDFVLGAMVIGPLNDAA